MSVLCDKTPGEQCCLLYPSAICDTYMASYCLNNTTDAACNCINSKLPCSVITDPNCSNNASSYKPYFATELCNKQPLCVNYFYDNGAAGNIIQVCGSTGLESFVLYRYPIITILLVFIFILSTIYVYNFIKTYKRTI
jgi:hypothetical protein